MNVRVFFRKHWRIYFVLFTKRKGFRIRHYRNLVEAVVKAMNYSMAEIDLVSSRLVFGITHGIFTLSADPPIQKERIDALQSA